jgi:hypothetical protein
MARTRINRIRAVGRIVATAALGLVSHAAYSAPHASPCAESAPRVPDRDASDARGSEFARRVASLDGSERDALVLRELLAGDMPRFLLNTAPVVLSGKAPDGSAMEVTLCVLPDYLSVGDARDFVRVPMGLAAALTIADAFGFVLPTRKIVDAIYAQAAVRLAPQPLPPGDRMRSTDYFVRHNEMVQAQRASAGAPSGALIAGHKKDIVLTKRLWSTPGRVAIYGWHREGGAPIQPLSIVHGARYADYSHGVRLVSAIAFVDGRPRSLFELLGDARFAPLLTDEGPLHDLRQALRLLAAQGASIGFPGAAH